jgi:tetratricopeptide (TPR) repeat protein/TolB-like protein
MSRLKRLIVEIHHRSLWQVLLIYVGGALVAYQAVQALTEGLGLPLWFPGLAVMLFIIGLPIVVATAFVHEAPAREATEHGPTPDEGIVQPQAEPLLRKHAQRRITWRNAGMAFVVALAIWGVVATAWMVFNPRRAVVNEAIADDAEPGIAVLPFSARGEGMEVWREGMVDLLSANLDGVPGLRSIDSRTVFARWREAVPESGEVDQATALRIARATGAEYALLGSAVSLGGEVRLSADIYETESGGEMGQAQVQGSPDSILSLVDRLAVQSLVVTMQQVESELPEIDVASVTTSSIPALRAWLEGEVHFRHGNDVAAAAAYERALDHDSTFAFAYYRLSSAYGWAEGMWGNRAEDARAQAFRWADRLPPRQADLMRGLHAWDMGEYREAHRVLWGLVQRYPDYADAWHQLGDFYYHSGPRIPVSLDEAHECFVRAVELDPSFATYRIHLIDLAFKHDPDSARIADMLTEYKQLGNADARVTLQLETAFALAFGSEDRRTRALQALDTLSNIGMLPSNNLLHPRFWRELEAVFLAMEKRRNRLYPGELFWTVAGGRGLAKRGFGYADRPQVWPEFRACYTLFWQMSGFPVSEERLAEADDVLVSRIDSLEYPMPIYCAGIRAADQGLWEQQARAIEALNEASRRSIASGGSGRTAHRYALATEAYGLWKQGNPDAALAVLEPVRRYGASNIVRFTLTRILMDLERWGEAIPYLKADWWGTFSPGHYDLARAYEQTGEYDKARREYAFFIDAWQDADPELQPWVEDARRALDRLTSER